MRFVLRVLISPAALLRVSIIILVAVSFTSCQQHRPKHVAWTSQTVNGAGVSREHWLYEWKFAGVTYEFAVSDALLRGASVWKAASDPLPLSPKKAERAAMDEARRLRPDVDSWWIEDVALRRVDDACWYYEVLLIRGDQVIMGLPPADFYLKVPVLMSGTAVHPLPRR